MKHFAYILAIFIFGLAVIPCHDEPKENIVYQINHSENSTEHHTDNKQCSPLSTCQCCASPVVVESNTIICESFLSLQKLFYSYNSTLKSTPFVSIWQPPKLS